MFDKQVHLTTNNTTGIADLLGAILSSIELGVLVTDLDLNLILFNEKLCEILYLPSETIRNQEPKITLAIKNRVKNAQDSENCINRAYKSPQSTQTDIVEIVNPEQILERITIPILEQDGKAIYRLWTFKDVTQEYRQQKLHHLLLEASNYHHDNPATVYKHLTNCVGFHYNSTAVLSIKDNDFLAFRAIGGLPNPLYEGEGGIITDSLCQFCLVGGQPVIILDTSKDPRTQNLPPVKMGVSRYMGVPLKRPNGDIIGTFCILDNQSESPLDDLDLQFLSLIAMRIGAEIERETQLSALKKDLQTTQEQLLQSEKLAVAGTLSATVAHDIRNILSAVAVELEMGSDDPAQTLVSVRNHLERFNILATRLLSYVQPAVTTHQSVNLNEAIERSLDLLASHLKLKEILVDYQTQDPTYNIEADPARLDHLFVNLILNALQAMNKGGKLTIRCSREQKNVHVSITDTGQGIQKEQLEAVFKPFVSGRWGGIGLGLFSCLQVVKASGGSITVQSEPGKGSTFHLRFPTYE
jgi:signal transduction histidine kinase